MLIKNQDEWAEVVRNGRFPILEFIQGAMLRFRQVDLSPALILCDPLHHYMLREELFTKSATTVVTYTPKGHWHNVRMLKFNGMEVMVIEERQFEGLRLFAEIKVRD